MHNGHEVLTLTPKLRVNQASVLQFSADDRRLMLLTSQHAGHKLGAEPDEGSWYELHTWDATPLPGPPP